MVISGRCWRRDGGTLFVQVRSPRYEPEVMGLNCVYEGAGYGIAALKDGGGFMPDWSSAEIFRAIGPCR